jgi:hypothetical protein
MVLLIRSYSGLLKQFHHLSGRDPALSRFLQTRHAFINPVGVG